MALNLPAEISFHFTLPKEGELIGPVVGATPPLINQLKQTLRHSTPIGESTCRRDLEAAPPSRSYQFNV